MASNGLHAKYTGLLWINTALSASSYFQHGWLFRHDIMQLTTHTHTHTKRNHCNHKAPDLDPNTARFRCQNTLLTCLTTANIILLCVTLKTTFSVAEFCFLLLEACSGRASRGFLIEARLWSWPICRTASSLTRHTHARTLFTAWNLERRSGLVRREKEKRGCGSQREGWREKGKQQNRKNYLFRGKSVGRLEIVEVSCCSSFLTPWLSHDKDSKNFSSGSRAWWQLLILHTSSHDGRFDSDRGSLFLATHQHIGPRQTSQSKLLQSFCKERWPSFDSTLLELLFSTCAYTSYLGTVDKRPKNSGKTTAVAGV